MPTPYMIITVRVTQADKLALPPLVTRFALYCLLKERGLILRHLEDWEGEMQEWDPPEELGTTIYRQTIPRKEHRHGYVC